MREDEAGLVDAIVAALADHVKAHPHAADSADGVARWWLGSELAGATPKQIECALELMVARDELRHLRLMDGRLLYARAER